ncbi:MAG: hypothetical protein V4649_12230 [Bacteroidota bacterium]
MRRSVTLILVLFCVTIAALAQKPFTEGVITYNIKLRSADNQLLTGTYTFTIKADQLRKDLALSNGYRELILINGTDNTYYSLNNVNGTMYAIQHKMADVFKRQEKFKAFAISGEASGSDLNELKTYKAKVKYKTGAEGDVSYTKDWYPCQAFTYERFPDARFLPLSYWYKNEENGMVMYLDVDKVEAKPVESAIFRIPADYKMITYEESQQLRK